MTDHPVPPHWQTSSEPPDYRGWAQLVRESLLLLSFAGAGYAFYLSTQPHDFFPWPTFPHPPPWIQLAYFVLLAALLCFYFYLSRQAELYQTTGGHLRPHLQTALYEFEEDERWLLRQRVPDLARTHPWIRLSFYTEIHDGVPVNFPTPGPYWKSGEANLGRKFIVVAYLPTTQLRELSDYWPDADLRSIQAQENVTFTDRFPRPDWWSSEPAL